MKITVVTSLYPSARYPARGTFVKTVTERLSRTEHVTVIAPEPLHRSSGANSDHHLDPSQEQGSLRVLRPRFPSFSNRLLPGGISTYRLTVRAFEWAAARAARHVAEGPDLAYGHFLFPAGETAALIGERWRVPGVVALGESTPSFYERHLGLERARAAARRLSGAIAVSHANRHYAVSTLGFSEDRVLMLPNATDTQRFAPRDRSAMRRKLGLPSDRPLAAFAGAFIERKGPLRVLRAAHLIPELGLVFLGEGPQSPSGEQVLFNGVVGHEVVADWLSACDMFVLPTTAEGSPNSVVEAMATGLPVIGGDISAMRAAVGDDAGILVDPLDEAGLSAAMRKLVDDPHLRRSMSAAARRKAESFTIEERVEQIAAWLHEIRRDFQSHRG